VMVRMALDLTLQTTVVLFFTQLLLVDNIRLICNDNRKIILDYLFTLSIVFREMSSPRLI
jgi:hypothetical protein